MLVGLVVFFAPTDVAEGYCRTHVCARLDVPPSSSSWSRSGLLRYLTWSCRTCHPEHCRNEAPGCQPG